MANYGIIDCGSNTVRLCIYRVEGKKKRYRKRDIRSLLNHKKMVGLSAHVENGVMTQRGIERACEVINDHLARAEYFKCKQLDVFATAFLRNCDNSEEALGAIQQGTGTAVNLLSAHDEAHLGFIGASCAEEGMDDGVLIDIGGGSTELTRLRTQGDFDNISIAQGSLSSFAQHVALMLPTQAEMTAITDEFQGHVLGNSLYKGVQCDTVYGIGGSARGIAKIYGEMFCNGKQPQEVTLAQIEQVLDCCRNDPGFFIHCALKAAPDRIHTAVPGCLIATEVMRDFHAKRLKICKCGVREGYLIDRMLP